MFYRVFDWSKLEVINLLSYSVIVSGKVKWRRAALNRIDLVQLLYHSGL